MDLDFQSIKIRIEEDECPVHKKHPVFIQTSEGFKYETCCDKFGQVTKEKATAILQDETRRAMQKAAKNIFKR